MASVPRPASAIPSLHIPSDSSSNGHTQHDAHAERIRPQSAVDHNDGSRMGTEHYDFAQSRQHNVSFERSGKPAQLSAGPFSAGPKTSSPSSPYLNNTSSNALVPVIALQTSIPKQHVSAEAALLHALTPKLMAVINAVIESERDQFEVQQDVTVTPSEEETIRRSIFEDFRWIDTLCRTPLLGPRAPATSRKLIEYNVQAEPQRPSPNRHAGMPSHLYADPYAASPPTMNPVAALGDNAFSSLGQPHMPSPSTAFAPPPHLAGQKRPFNDGQYARQTPPQHPYQPQGGHGSDPVFVQSTLSLLKGLLGMLHEMQSRNHAHASSASSVSSAQTFEDPSTSKKDAAVHQHYQHKLASLLEATMGIKYISDFAQAQQIALPALHACHHVPHKKRGASDEEEDDDDEDEESQDEEESTEPCLQVCASEQYLLRHVQQCHAERAKPFVCGIEGCGKSYASSERLVDHQASHSTDKPFKCRMPDCDKVFKTRKNRRNHEMTHNDERPHACPWEGCGKRFSRKDNMMTHYKLHEKRTEEGLDALFGRGRGKRTKVNDEGSKSGRASATQQQQKQSNNTMDGRQQPSPNFNAANYAQRHPQPSFHDPNAAHALYAPQNASANRSPFGIRPNYSMSPSHHPMSPYADPSLAPGAAHANQFAPGTPNMTAANGNFAGSMNWAKAAPNMAHLQAPPFNSAPGTPGMIGMTRSPTHRGVNAAGLTLSPSGLYFPSPNLFGALSPLQSPNQNPSLPGPAQQP